MKVTMCIKISNKMSLGEYYGLVEMFENVSGVDIDMYETDHDDDWTYSDIDMNEDITEEQEDRLTAYIESNPMMEFDWDAMREILEEM